MYTVTYYPNDTFEHFFCSLGDKTSYRNNEHWNEGPSFCVRLWCWEMPND